MKHRSIVDDGIEIKLQGGNLLVYRAEYPPEGITCLMWWEEDQKGEPTEVYGEIIVAEHQLNTPYEKLVLEDYIRKIE